MKFAYLLLPILLFGSCAAVQPQASKQNLISAVPSDLPVQLIPQGSPRAIINNVQRKDLGIKNGPDCPVAQLLNADGSRYLYFSGATQGNVRGTFRFRSNADLTKIVADPKIGTEPRPVLLPGKVSPNPDGQKEGGTYTGFDRDYAGGGTVFNCASSNASIGSKQLLYFYHGENHTDPWGTTHRGPKLGWTGLGMSKWNQTKKSFEKTQQVIGMGLTNKWTGTRENPLTKQRPAISSMGNVVYNPSDGYLYLYYTDQTDQLEYAGKGYQCDTRPCITVARALAKDICAAAEKGTKVLWRKYYKGKFSEPALFTSQTANSLNLLATGGKFTPLFKRTGENQNKGEVTPHVTYLEGKKIFAMVSIQRPDDAILVRYSKDGVSWSEPQTLVEDQSNQTTIFYPYIYQEPVKPNVVGLTYTLRSTESWRYSELMYQGLIMK